MSKHAGYSLPSAGTAVTAASLVLTVTLVAFRHPGGPWLDALTARKDAPESPAAGGASSSTAAEKGKVFSAYISRLARERRALGGGGGAHPGRSRGRGGRPGGPSVEEEDLSPDHLFIAVKSTQKYHRQRLDLLLDTWMSRHLRQTYVFTDGEDEELRKKIGGHLINTNCSSAHNRHALSCKMAQEYDAFIRSDKRWFCHVDDDNYVHVEALVRALSRYSHTQDVYMGRPSLERPIEALERLGSAHTKQVRFWFATGGAGFCISRGLALKMSPWASDNAFMATAERIRLPDDCTVGYIIQAQLGVSLTRCPLFHSHLENLALVTDVHNQVTLSYGTVENNRNTVNIRGPFSLQEDPTRFRSVHCVLYPDTPWCPSLQRL